MKKESEARNKGEKGTRLREISTIPVEDPTVRRIALPRWADSRGYVAVAVFVVPVVVVRRGIGLTSVLFLLRAVNPRILALTRCRTGRVTESVFINGPLGSGGSSALRQRGSNEGLAFCALKYRLIAPGFWRRFCHSLRCPSPPSTGGYARPWNVIGRANVSEILNSSAVAVRFLRLVFENDW